ncbi:MAG TPA: hypothetical protein DIC52_17855, partial [Candidatus Latescibacteria bacterium]|nr:hypothetical protein [Candidatus Latescibacterota bacterium]
MFLDDVAVEESGGDEPNRFLEPRHAVRTGSGAKRARLTGKMHERIEQNGGLMVSSSTLVARLRETGLSMVTIDTDKGDDLPQDVKPMTDPTRKPPPAGRLVHYDEEIERATEIRNEMTETLKTAMEDIASGKGVDAEKINAASEVITESILRNVDARSPSRGSSKHDPYTRIPPCTVNVCALVVAVPQADGIDPGYLPIIMTATLLRDVGKTRVPLEILNKPGRFEPEELEQMRKHAVYSGVIMRE